MCNQYTQRGGECSLVMALVLGVATMALGATGGNFILGKGNSAGATSKLTSAVAGSMLKLINNGTAAAATALNLTVPSGKPPLTVNSSTKVDNFNADLLDSKSEADFYAAGPKVADSTHTDQADKPTL
jgi:hypothetical protein